MNPTIETIQQRRSLRAYSDNPISENEKQSILDCTMRAPTAGNMMLYSILEVADQDKKNRLVKSCDNQPFIAKAQLVLIFLADMQRWYDYYVHCDVEELCRKNGTEFHRPQEADLMLASCDALVAAQTAVLAAESMGIGSCYIGDIMENYEIHREMFDLPPLVFPVAMLCFGHYPENSRALPLTQRFPQEAIVHTDRYRRLGDDGLQSLITQHYSHQFKNGKYLKNAENPGQHFYLKKTGSEFFREMRRSVKAAFACWLGKDNS